MNKEEEAKILQAMSNNIFNSLSIHGILEAVKYYSVQCAQKKFEELSEEQLNDLLEEIESNTQDQSED